MATARRTRKFDPSQTATLFAIWDLQASGSFPTAKQLAARLKIGEQPARMRVHRLKVAGYLRKKDGNLAIDGNVVIDQPETATLVMHLFRLIGTAPGLKLTRAAIAKIARSEFRFHREHIGPLLELLVRVGYLAKIDGWPEHLKLGPRVAAEFEYLNLLASRFKR